MCVWCWLVMWGRCCFIDGWGVCCSLYLDFMVRVCVFSFWFVVCVGRM